MGQSLGDLFVKLGFEVDDSKLKSFDASIKSTFNTILGFAGITASVAGFVSIAKGAEETALSLDRLTTIYGTSTKAAQAWGAAVHEAWPDRTYAQGLSSFGNIAAYINNAAMSTSGMGALYRLGVNDYTTADRQHPEKAINELYDTIPKLLAAHPEQRGLYSKLVGDVTGDPANIKIFEMGRAFANKAAENITVLQDDLDKITETSRKISGMEDQWDKFINHALGSLAPGATGFLETVDKSDGVWNKIWNGVDWIGKNSYVPGLIDDIGKHSYLNTPMDGAKNIGAELGKGMGETTAQRAARARKYFEAQGWTDEQAAGMVNRLLKEDDTLAPERVNPSSGAYGIAQWLSKSRLADFKAHAGHDIKGSSFEDQLEFMNYELTKGHEQAAGKAIAATNNRADAEQATRDKYERPDLTVNVTQNISSDDAHQAGKVSAQALQDNITAAYLNRLGNNQ